MNIPRKVQQIIKTHHTRNPFEIIKGMNVILVYAPLKGVKGFYQHWKRNHIIYIDENLEENERKIVLAHELGHMILHKSSNALFMDGCTYLKTSVYEQEADEFAAELLIPDSIITENPHLTLSQIGTLCGYGERLLQYKRK
jgi:Zn-dependent peptidase ImmA (M78 family)